MQALNLKTDIHQMIDKLNDKNILSAIRSLLKAQLQKKEVDFWDELSVEQQEVIEESLQQIKDGKVFSHDNVMKETKRKFKFLN